MFKNKNTKKETNVKRIIVKITKRFFISIAIILALMVILIIGTYLYNKASLKKEAKLIQHKGEYVEVDGHKMNLLIEGDGEKTLVFLAGAGTPSPILDFKPLTDRLNENYKVVIIEKFGYGYSDEIDGERTVDIILIIMTVIIIISLWKLTPYKHFCVETVELGFGVRSLVDE